MEVSNLAWGLTLGLIVLLIVVDLFLHRKPTEVTLKEAAWATIFWTALGLAFGLVILAWEGGQASGEYFAGYLLERMLSVDNVFVFVVLLGYFAVPPSLQHRALTFGVVAALILRFFFIFAGVALIERFEWTIYLFGALLLYTAFKLITSSEEEVHPEKNVGLKLLRKIVPVTNEYQGNKLVVKQPGSKKRAVTPLFAVLVVIGTTDIIFAVDSIPAIFAVTHDSYLICTSNAFALLGLRAMAFLLARVMDRFEYLKHSLAIVLALVGLKMMVSGFYHVDIWISLAVITVVLASGVAFSLFATRRKGEIDESDNEVLQ